MPPYDETLLVLDGMMDLTVDDATVSVYGGEIVIVPAGTTHGGDPGQPGHAGAYGTDLMECI